MNVLALTTKTRSHKDYRIILLILYLMIGTLQWALSLVMGKYNSFFFVSW